MSPVLLLTLAIFTPAVVGAATLALPRRAMRPRVLLAALAPLASVILLVTYVRRAGFEATLDAIQWMPALHLNWALQADRLGLFFALLVAGVGLLVVLYTRAYFGPDPQSLYRFYPSLHLFMTAMLGVVLADNFLLLLVFWELTSISSFLLIGWERDDPKAVRNAMQAFVVTGAGGLALMAGLVLIGLASGAWTITALAAAMKAGALASPGMLTAGFVLVFAGAAAKSAQWPLHFWLPGAMAAPTPVSAYLHSATMVKAGIYLVGRLWPVLALALPLWPRLIIPIGAVTMVLGAYVALRKSDLKQVFAYTTVSQLGLLMTMYGLGGLRYGGEANLLWDVTQVLNHALYKAPLFLLAGAIGHVIHTRELPLMRGLVRRGGQQAVMAWLLILAAYALAAGPLTLSFTAKEFFYYQVYHALRATGNPLFYVLVAAAVATGALNTAVFVRLARVLLGRPDEAPHARSEPPATDRPARYVAHPNCAVDESPSREDVDHDVPERGLWPAILWLPAALLLAFQFVGGLVPGAHAALFGHFERPESLNYAFDALARFPMTWDAFAHPSVPLYMSLAGYAIGGAIAFSPLFIRLVNDAHDRLFPAFYDLVVDGGGRGFGLFQTGYFRTYMAMSALAIVAVFAWSVRGVRDYVSLADAGPLLDRDVLPGYLFAALMCLAALLMPIVRNRASRVLVLGTAGTAASAIFYIYQAPDLALTQISIEVVSLILFLLVLGLLPDGMLRDRTRVAPRVVLAVCVGGVMSVLTLAAATGERPPRVSPGGGGDDDDVRAVATLGDYFLRNSYVGRDTIDVPRDRIVGGGIVDRGAAHPDSFGTHPREYLEHGAAANGGAEAGAAQIHKGGGGANVVNVILVDFRGFDTMGEITVLALAALGVWTLFRRHGGGGRGRHDVAQRDLPPAAERMSSTILAQAAKLLVPLALMVSAYIFFKGHQTPGGGFVGGLVASVALILYRMSAGADALRRLLPVRERTLIATGLLLAGGAGVAALLAGLPFLTSNNGYLPLPGYAPFHWASVMAFDAGVYLVVVGVTVGMIDVLSREIERPGQRDEVLADAAPGKAAA